MIRIFIENLEDQDADHGDLIITTLEMTPERTSRMEERIQPGDHAYRHIKPGRQIVLGEAPPLPEGFAEPKPGDKVMTMGTLE